MELDELDVQTCLLRGVQGDGNLSRAGALPVSLERV